MVNLQNIPFLPFLRGFVRARRSRQWPELKELLKQGIATSTAGKRSKSSLLGWLRLGSARRSAQPPPLFQMAASYWISQSIYVAAKLDIADAIHGSPKSCQQIAEITGANEHALFRLLRALCNLGICKEQNGKYELTSQGGPLRSGAPGSLRSMVLTLGEIHYQAWGNLLHSIKTGQPAFNDLFGTGLFEHLTKNAQDGHTFNTAMTDFSGLASYAVALAYDFSTIRSIVDVGGGHGKFLLRLLDINPHLQGTVLDLPAVIQGTEQHLETLNGRCKSIAGDFFTAVPEGADAYILCGVIHDWDDASSIAILKNCRKAMGPRSRVLLVENMVPETREPSFSTLLDLNMLVMCGGRERTESEFRSLFQAAGLKMTRVISTSSPLKIIEAC